MRINSLNILSRTVLVQKFSQNSGKSVYEFKIDLESLTEMLCFNSPSEASSFLATQGYLTNKDPATGTNQVTRGGEAGEVWKPRTNYKYIEAKKIKDNKVHSRADIIRGIQFPLSEDHRHRPQFSHQTQQNLILVACRSDSIPAVTVPEKRSVSIPVLNKIPLQETAKALEPKEREEISMKEEKKRVERQMVQEKLKQEMQARKEKEEQHRIMKQQEEENRKKFEEEKQRKAKEAEAKRKREEEERRRIEDQKRKEKEEAERKRRQIIKKREEMTERNTKMYHRQIIGYFWQKLKKYHQSKQQIKKFVIACLTPPNSKPRISHFPYGGYFDRKFSILPNVSEKECFTNAIKHLLKERINLLPSEYENIHFRITLFLNIPINDSRKCSLFNNWLIKSLTNRKKTLLSLTEK